MIRASRILAGLAVVAITATIALTPTTSDARDAGGHKRPVSAPATGTARSASCAQRPPACRSPARRLSPRPA